MIYESFPWKRDLIARKRLIQQYNKPGLLYEEGDHAYTILEKALFCSAFIIRKLIDCKGKVSDDVDNYKFIIKGVAAKKQFDVIHRWPDENSHDWEHERTYTKAGADICNWLIHSYIFSFVYDEESGKVGSFFGCFRL